MFPQYASVVKDGEHFMTDADFVIRYLGLVPEQNYNVETVKLLGNVIDTTKDGLVSQLLLFLFLYI
jgi:solute carrier family 25 (mitochondrial aspartate/glutamate transporter), member 12/13